MKQYDWSERKLKLAIVLAIAIIAWLCFNASSQAQPIPGNLSPGVQEVVKLTQAHMGDDVILAYVRNSGSSYSLSADDILYLNSQGVSQAVISALLNAKGTPPPAAATAPPMSVPPPSVAQPASPAPSVAAPVPAPSLASPPAGSEVNLGYFQTQLAPYGSWVDAPGYGSCWRPTVQDTSPGWAPYLDAGHWQYTDEGWYWASDYPWGEYAFHYGRWARSPRLGWLWIPGYEWGPGWVCWRNCEADGYCGWAPLPPGARFQAGVGLLWNGRLAVDADFGLGADAFFFIPFDRFWAHDYRACLAPGWRVPALFRVSIVANGYRFAGGRFIVDGIGRDRIARLTHHEVVAGRIEFGDARIGRARELERSRALDMDRRPIRGDERRDDHRGY